MVVIKHKSTKIRGVVLPVALVLLLIVLVAGVSAARVAVSHHAFSDNLRAGQVARQAAEAGLTYCEQVVIDLVDQDSANYGTEVTGKVRRPEPPTADLAAAHWNDPGQWLPNAMHVLEVPQTYSDQVQADARLTHQPTCMAELISEDRFLITARGLSNDATIDSNGRLLTGSEVWLQSILKPVPVTTSNTGGVQ